MGRTGVERAQAPPPTGWSTAGTVAAYAAAIVAFAYALVNLYWAAGGHGLVSMRADNRLVSHDRASVGARHAVCQPCRATACVLANVAHDAVVGTAGPGAAGAGAVAAQHLRRRPAVEFHQF